MTIAGLESRATEGSPADVGAEMLAFMADVFPFCRSITGNGLRSTLQRIGETVPVELTEVPTGTTVLDWTIPKEWNVRDAWVADADGRRVVDFQDSNLHVLNYSAPVRTRLSLEQLRPHLHTLPDHPTWVPYRTSYYAESWGFCLSQEALDRLPDGEYEAVVDATLQDGSLTYGECVLPGASDEEILISSHVCHPSLANDNLSGVAVATFLARELSALTSRRYTYRFLFAPTTIGTIAWLAGHEDLLPRIRAGLVIACVGDPGPMVYKRSRHGDREIDRAATHLLAGRVDAAEVVDFSPYGDDTRQFCSPGFDLPVGTITRSGHDRSERHHTSADDLASIEPAALADTLGTCRAVLDILEQDATLVSLNPKGEPQLGRRGLYRSFGGRAEQGALESALLWVMNQADGQHTMLDVADRAGLPFGVVREAARALEGAALLRCEPPQRTRRDERT
jgi:aminopeptidase-like protein